jgi:hypothetical protein
MEAQTVRMFIFICGFLCTTQNLCNAAHKDESVVNIGVILDYNSRVGKVAKTALEIAAEDINRDTRLPIGSRLVLHFRDSRGEVVVGASAGNLHLLCFYGQPSFYNCNLNILFYFLVVI